MLPMLMTLFFVVTPQNLNKEVIKGYTLSKLACPTCSEVILQKELLIRLEVLSEIYGSKLYITSGYRNIEDNLRVGGQPTSAHLYGAAVDIVLPRNPKRLIWICNKVFPIVIVNYKKRYIHLQLEHSSF